MFLTTLECHVYSLPSVNASYLESIMKSSFLQSWKENQDLLGIMVSLFYLESVLINVHKNEQ